MIQPLRTLGRVTALLGGCAAAGAAAWWLSGDLLRPVLVSVLGSGATSGASGPSFAEALDAVCATVLLACVGWLVLGTALTVASYAAEVLSPASPATALLDTLADRGCPRRLRRLVLASLGVAISAGAAAPATAHPSGLVDRPGAHGTAAADGLGGLRVPDRTTGSTPSTPSAATATRHAVRAGSPRAVRAGSPHADLTGSADPVRSVLVGPGDSLWTIASDLLPPGASDRAVTGAWHRLHLANRSRIGADPDLILPGTRLGVPDLLPTEREEPR